jgi:hypothetical protein
VPEDPPLPVTVRLTVAACASVPLVPVIVTVDVPVGVLPAVATIKVDVLPGLIEAGLKVAVAPLGKPLALKVRVPLKPLRAVVFTV